jgi:hypothetical protein
MYADLLGLVRAACTHASHAGRELPALPFYVKEHVAGWLRPSFADQLRRWPHVFEVGGAFVALKAKPDTPHGRTEAMAQVLKDLARDGVITGWRDEMVSVTQAYGQPELLRMERAASRHFGIMGYGAHLNGFTRRGRHGQRVGGAAQRKQAGGSRQARQPRGRAHIRGHERGRDAAQGGVGEAGIPPGLLAGLNCISAVRVEYSVPEGLHREVLFVHDLWLPDDFKPANQDGEVSEIRSMAVEEVLQKLLAGEFTLDAGVVMIDGLLRLGAVLPEDSQYLDLLRLMKP